LAASISYTNFALVEDGASLGSRQLDMGTPVEAGGLIALLAPLVIIQLGLLVFALRDLLNPERKVKGGNKLVWGLVIVFINLIGPLVYLVAGRDED